MNFTITPKKLIGLAVLFFWFSNLYATIFLISSGSLDSIYHNTKAPEIFVVVASFLLVSFLYAVLFLFLNCLFLDKTARLDFKGTGVKSAFISCFLIFILFVYIYQILAFGLGRAGGEVIDVPSPWSYLFVVIGVDYFSIMYVALIGLNRYTRLILLLVIISSLARGWLGDIITIFILLLALLCDGKKIKSLIFSRYFIFFVIVVVFYDVIIQLRANYRLGGLDLLLSSSYVFEFGFSNFLEHAHEFLMRFQQVYSVCYYFVHSDYFNSIYAAGEVRPLMFEGVINNYFYRFSGGFGEALGYIFADHNRVLVEGRRTAFTPSLIPYFLMSIFSVLYSLLLLVLFFLISYVFRRKHVLLMVAAYYFLILFSFGWIGAFMSFLMAYFLFMIVYLWMVPVRINVVR